VCYIEHTAVSQIFAPVCSITTTKRRRYFWAAWWTAPPAYTPFRKPDAEGGGAATLEEALAKAELRAERTLTLIDPLWARAWIRILRGEHPWPSRESREPRGGRASSASSPARRGDADVSIWTILDVARDSTDDELKAAYRRRVLEAHPDQGGDEAAFRRVLDAYEEALRRRRRPPPRRR
jgi:hypothetical protein